MNVLITGGAGFIGSSLSLKLIELGYHVTVLDNLSKQIHGEFPEKSELFMRIKDKVEFIRGDVRSKEDLRGALNGADVVFHLAAETGTGQSMYEINRYVEVNINGTANLLDILANESNCVKKLIVASSRAVYGEGKYLCQTHGEVYPNPRLEEHLSMGDFNVKCPKCGENVEVLSTSEDSMIQPSSIYGFTKYGQESMCMIMGKALQIPVVVLRYQNVYGPGQSLKNPYTGILSIFSTRIKNGNEINIFEDGFESRDFVYIDDVVDATYRTIKSEQANYQVFNVGTGVSTTVSTVAAKLIENYQTPVNVNISRQYRIGDIRHNYADMANAFEKLSFIPKFSFEDGIKHFTDWVNKQEIQEDNYEKAMLEMKEKGLYK
ncbi:NAD-dependent epimerase/dehydratase family protein [Peribacillus asahii]|uniref:NAD-dependent epimerase/dehydratase family protein n=1 Tax=Peribacillus asahii TaxID=228899 RepID=UPI00207A4C38|nr:NAD-dependent epimerase/dehydratase family protein [Peribacillus asahii]USK68332.1 NAD-dependent epimerase/dehydratase family protein [Peribacillus asahii]